VVERRHDGSSGAALSVDTGAAHCFYCCCSARAGTSCGMKMH
jgi:hypothetical protein